MRTEHTHHRRVPPSFGELKWREAFRIYRFRIRAVAQQQLDNREMPRLGGCVE